MVPTRRRSIALFTTLSVAAAAPAVALAGGSHGSGGHGGGGDRGAGPQSIALPNGFSPEGVASSGHLLYAGSLSTGAVYRADARSGQGSVLVPPQAGRVSQGLKVAGKALVVAGGTTGHAYVYDAKTGSNIADLTLTTGNSQVNDVAIGAGAAWFTDSRQQQFYRVSLTGSAPGRDDDKGRGRDDDHSDDKGRDHDDRNDDKSRDRDDRNDDKDRGRDDDRTRGDDAISRLSFGAGHSKGKKRGHSAGNATLTATTVKITGDLAYDADPATFEANGIEVLNRSGDLLIVQSRTGKLFRVDGQTGVSKEVPITGGDLLQGDGILLKGNTLYVVKNRVNQIAVVKLDKRGTSGVLERTITSPLFRVPTTVARIGHDLFAVNARFGTPSTPETDYDIVRVSAK